LSSRFKQLLAAALLASLAALPATAARAGEPAAFSGARAMTWLRAQCAFGPRPPGSPALASVRDLIVAHADSLSLAVVRLPFSAPDPLGEGTLAGVNLVVSAGPRGGRRLWLATHYDTRPIADRDPDPAKRGRPILGANDGASGTAVLLHLMELLADRPPPRGVDLIFLDLEDSGPAGDADGFCLGSRHLARTWGDFGNPLAVGEPAALVLLDMVGGKGMVVRQEGYSRELAPDLVASVWQRAAALGLPQFPAEVGGAIFDDHVPFLEAGIPAIDLIGLPYPAWHTLADTPAACDPASLASVGTLIASLCYQPLDGF
jgi:glutaminyl-peptide cyclotransferase